MSSAVNSNPAVAAITHSRVRRHHARLACVGSRSATHRGVRRWSPATRSQSLTVPTNGAFVGFDPRSPTPPFAGRLGCRRRDRTRRRSLLPWRFRAMLTKGLRPPPDERRRCPTSFGIYPISASSHPPSASSKQLLPWLVAVAFFMESLDTTILNTAVPVVSQALGVAPLSMKSVLASYTLEPRRLHSDQRLDGRPFRNSPGVRVRDRPLHPRVLPLRRFEQHPSPRRLPRPAGLRRGHDGSGGPSHPGANLRQIRAHPRHELCRHSRIDRTHARADRRRPDRRISPLAIHIFRQSSHRDRRPDPGLSASARLSRTEHQAARYRRAHPLRFRRRLAVLRAGDIRRSYVGTGRDSGAAGAVAIADRGLWAARDADGLPVAAAEAVSHSHVQRGGKRQLLHPAWHRRRAVSPAAPLPGRARIHAHSIGPAHHAPGDRGHEHEISHADEF